MRGRVFPRGSRVLVGASMWQTPGAQSREMAQINADVGAFSAELTAAAHAHGYDVHDPMAFGGEASAANAVAIAHDATLPIPNVPIVKFFASVWKPWVGQWLAFYNENKEGAWWSNPAAEAEGFAHQLTQMRGQAEGLGLHLTSPAPEKFSTSLLDPHHDVVDAVRDKADDLWKAGKWIIIGGGVLIGGVLLTSIVSNTRSGRDPIQSWRRR